MTVKVRHSWIRQEDDCEIYKAGRNYVLAVWGWATGSDLGPHNEFDTQVAVYTWEGEEPDSVENLPRLNMSDHWTPYKGFNFAADSDGGPNWADYAEKLDDILDEIAAPWQISLDNGLTYYSAEDIPAYLLTRHWGAIVQAMDDETREHVAALIAPCTKREFLGKYLEIAPHNLIIG